LSLLVEAIENDRYPLSPRIRLRRQILARFGPMAPAPMTRIIIVVLALVAAVSACQYPGCVEADRVARQCGVGHCAEFQQAQKRACADLPGDGPRDSFGDLGLPPFPSMKSAQWLRFNGGHKTVRGSTRSGREDATLVGGEET
jgi:hypothetical protein